MVQRMVDSLLFAPLQLIFALFNDEGNWYFTPLCMAARPNFAQFKS